MRRLLLLLAIVGLLVPAVSLSDPPRHSSAVVLDETDQNTDTYGDYQHTPYATFLICEEDVTALTGTNVIFRLRMCTVTGDAVPGDCSTPASDSVIYHNLSTHTVPGTTYTLVGPMNFSVNIQDIEVQAPVPPVWTIMADHTASTASYTVHCWWWE